jgi:hypothetical protein
MSIVIFALLPHIAHFKEVRMKISMVLFVKIFPKVQISQTLTKKESWKDKTSLTIDHARILIMKILYLLLKNYC